MKITKPFTVIAILFITNTGIDAQTKNCRSFRDGSFTTVVEDEENTTLIERKGKIQTESTDGGKNTATFDIIWLDECSYRLRPTRETFKKHPDWPKNTQFTVVITETGNDGYTQESSSNLNDIKVTNKIKKVK